MQWIPRRAPPMKSLIYTVTAMSAIFVKILNARIDQNSFLLVDPIRLRELDQKATR